MKRSAILLCTALSLHASADEAAHPATPVLDAARAVNGELRTLFPPNGDPATGLERMRTFQFSPATAAQLQPMFGTSQPVTVSPARRVKGGRTYDIGLHALDFAEPDGSRIEWSALTGQVQVTQQGKRIAGAAAWPSITLHEKDGELRVSGMTMKFDQHRAAAGLWLGATKVSVGEISAQTPSGRFIMPGLAGAFQLRQRGSRIDILYDLAFGTARTPMRFGGTEVGALKLKLTLAGIPVSSMVALRDAGDRLHPEGDAAARVEQMKPMFAAMGRALVDHGALLRLDGLELARGHRTASLAGSVRVAPFKGLDQATAAQVLRHLDARFKLRVPSDMVLDIAQVVARQQLQAKTPGTPVTEDAVRQSAQTMADVMVGRLVNGGYAKVERGYIVSDVTFKDGVLRANGKVFELPATPAPQRPADQDRLRERAFMPPRRVADRCTLPPFPEPMLRDQPQFNWKFALVIGADGRSHDVKLEQASAWPAYDAEITAAVAQCQWIPALVRGTEADFPSNWEIGRDENGEPHWELTGTVDD